MRRLINTFCVSLFVSQFPAAISQAQAVVGGGAQAPGAAFLCRYTDGSRAGRTEPLSGAFDRATIRAGSSCSDGISSTGVVIAAQLSAQLAPANADEAPERQAASTSICQFSSGPRAGEIADLGRMPGVPPVPVGGTCSDGASSKGTAIAAPAGGTMFSWSNPIQGSAAGAERTVSTICQFMSGPKAHGWHDYAPLPAAPLGSPCRDGVSSAGIVMASGHGQAY